MFTKSINNQIEECEILHEIEFLDLFANINTNLEKIPVLYEDNHILVVIKPAGVASQKDKNTQISILEIIKRDLKQRYNKTGDVYLGLVYRLDTPTTGVMVFAKTSKALERLNKYLREQNFNKKYIALLAGNLVKEKTLNKEYYLENYLIKNEKLNKSFVTSKENKKAKLAKLKYKILEVIDEKYTKIEIDLITGRHHQIRVQFANLGYPLLNDSKYGKRKTTEILKLFAKEITFKHPTKEETITINIDSIVNKLLQKNKKDK